VHRAFTYRLRPTKGQEQRLTALLDAQREVYNAALEARRGAWTWEHRRVTKFEQYGEIKALRDARPEVLAWGVTVCRGTLDRLDEAFQGFFRRVKAGRVAGYPRFKGRGRWDSVSWPDISGWKMDEDTNRLYLQGVGHIRFRPNRPLRGEARTITVRRSGRHWDVIVFCANVPAQPLPSTGAQVGIDLGVAALVATSDGELVPSARPRKALAERLATAQRDKARRRKGSRAGSSSIRYQRANQAIGRIKRKEANVRKDHLHKVSRRIVDSYDLICHEELRITNMVRSARGTVENPGVHVAAKSGLNDAISDSGWGRLLSMIAYKAEDAGRTDIAVNPRTPPSAAMPAGTWHGRTGSPRRCSDVGGAATRPTPTSTPPATSSGPGWPCTLVRSSIQPLPEWQGCFVTGP